MKHEEERDIIDLLIEALKIELEDILLDSLDNPSQFDSEDENKVIDELDFEIK